MLKPKLSIRIADWIRSFFGKNFDVYEQNSSMAVNIVNTIKALIGSPIVALIVQMTTTQVDDILLARAKNLLLFVTKDLLNTRGIILEETNHVGNVMESLTKYISTLSGDDKGWLYTELSARLTKALSNDEISISKANTITQFTYQNKI